MVANRMMGFAYGLGGTFSPLIGKLAGIFSVQPVLTGVAFVFLLSRVLIYYFPAIMRTQKKLA